MTVPLPALLCSVSLIAARGFDSSGRSGYLRPMKGRVERCLLDVGAGEKHYVKIAGRTLEPLFPIVVAVMQKRFDFPSSPSVLAVSAFRLVLDTNVILALWHFRDPALLPLAWWLADARLPVFARQETLDELADVLTRPHFRLALEEQAAVLARYRARATLLPAAEAGVAVPLPRVRDADDQKFLELARDARATHLLSRDRAVLAAGRQPAAKALFLTLSPERFCALHPKAGTMEVFNHWPFGPEQTHEP